MVIKKFENVMKFKKRILCAPPAPPEGLFLFKNYLLTFFY